MTASTKSDSQKARLLVGLARSAIERELGASLGPRSEPPEDYVADGVAGGLSRLTWLNKPAATFVTLELDGRLRGCIGSLEAGRALRDDLEQNARAAAFEDPRFPPLTAEELEGLEVEVSVLSRPEPVTCSSENELLSALRPGVDGLVLECGRHHSTFLPQVWDKCTEPRLFVEALKRKAGLPSDFWSDEIRFSRYTVEKYAEP